MSDQIAKRKYRQSWHGMTPKPNNFIQTPKLKQFAGPVKRRLFGRKAEKENAETSVGLDCSKDMFEDDEEFDCRGTVNNRGGNNNSNCEGDNINNRGGNNSNS